MASIVKSVKPIFQCSQRNFGVAAPLLNKVSDPIQKLFLEKLQEYKASAQSKKMESNPDLKREMDNELDRVAKQFGGGAGVDMTKFPSFKFEDPKIDATSAN